VGWLKFSDELRKARDYLSAKAGCGSGSSLASVKTVGKEEEVRPGLAPLWKGPSFVEVLRSGSVSAVKKEPIVGGRHSRWRASPEEQCALDLLSMVRHAEVEPRSVVDCFSLESPLLCQHLRPKGKKVLSRSNLNFENSKSEYSRTRTWNRLGFRFYVALGRAVRKLMDWFSGSGMGRKHLGFCVARFWPKPKAAHTSRSLPETTPKWSTRMFLVWPPPGGLVGDALGATEGAGPALSASPASKKFRFPP
jgi:hypothetical protein